MRVKDRVAVVTGSGRGIGEATVRRLSEEGAKVVVTDINEENALKVAEDIKAKGGQAIAVKTDVTKIDEVEALMKKSVESFGKLDILVNSHGNLKDRMIWNMSEEEWDSVMFVHLKGTFNTCRHACVLMREQKSGRIIKAKSFCLLVFLKARLSSPFL